MQSFHRLRVCVFYCIEALFNTTPPTVFTVDPVCCWTRLCHRAGEDFPLLLSEAQDEGHQFLPWRSVCGADWLAYHWSCAGGLWLFPLVQV